MTITAHTQKLCLGFPKDLFLDFYCSVYFYEVYYYHSRAMRMIKCHTI